MSYPDNTSEINTYFRSSLREMLIWKDVKGGIP